MLTTRTLLFVVVCLCLQGVHSSSNGPRRQEESVAGRLKRAIPAPRFQEQQAEQEQHHISVEVAHAEAESALAIIHSYDNKPINTPEQRQRVLELEQAHNQIVERQRMRQRELRSQEFEHLLNIEHLERQRDTVLRHVRTVADEIAARQAEEEAVQQFSSSSTAEEQVDEASSSSSTAGGSEEPESESSSSSSTATIEEPEPLSSSSSTGTTEEEEPESSSSSTATTETEEPESSSSSSTGTTEEEETAESSSSSSTGTTEEEEPESSSSSTGTTEEEEPVSSSSSSTGTSEESSEESSSSSSTGTTEEEEPELSSSSTAVQDNQNVTSSTAVEDNQNVTSSTGPKPRFIPGFIDHDPFAKGQTFVSDGTADHIDWPSPIADESDPVDVMNTVQPTGGYYTPEVLPPVPETVSATASSAPQWLPVETTTSSILEPESSQIGWRWKQKLRSQSHQQRSITPDDEGNVFNLLQLQSHIKTKAKTSVDEFSAVKLASEQQDLIHKLSEMDKSKPGWMK